MFEQAVRANPNGVTAYANQAHLFTEAGVEPDPDGAATAFGQIQRALALEPNNPTLYHRLGLIFCRERRYDEALPQFQQALALAAGNAALQADCQNDLGLALFLSGDAAAARQAFEAALKLAPNHAHALCNLSLTQMQEAVSGPVLERLQRAARVDAAGGAVRGNYGYGLCRIGAINDGLLELKEAIGLNSRLFEALYNLGKTYADYDVLDIAERYLARALQFSPRSGEALTALGVIKTQQKLIPQALQYFQSGVKLYPQSALIRLKSGDRPGSGRRLSRRDPASEEGGGTGSAQCQCPGADGLGEHDAGQSFFRSGGTGRCGGTG